MRVELGGALERVGLLAEDLADRRRAGRQRPVRRMPVELAPAGDRALAADVERGERVELAGIRDADDHAELLLHVGIGGGRLHAAEFERRALVLVEIGQERRGLHGLRSGSAAARRRARRRSPAATGAPSCGHQHAGDAVVGAHAVDVVLHDLDAGGLARADRRVQLVDRRLFETKRLRPAAPVLFMARHSSSSLPSDTAASAAALVLATGHGFPASCPKALSSRRAGMRSDGYHPEPADEVHAMNDCLLPSVCAILALTEHRRRATYPSRPITFIVPYGAGGPADTMGRTMGEAMRPHSARPW